MTTQPTLFEDLYREPLAEPAKPAPSPHQSKSGEERKREGIARAVASKPDPVALAREIACDVARGVLPHADERVEADGLCSADDVYWNWPPKTDWIGNAAGGLFRDGNWVLEREIKSVRPWAHTNKIGLWKLKHPV